MIQALQHHQNAQVNLAGQQGPVQEQQEVLQAKPPLQEEARPDPEESPPNTAQ